MSDTSQGPGWWLASDGKWYPPQPPPPSATPAWTSATKTLGIAAGVVVIAAFLPWATINIFGASVSKAGTSGDGNITLVLGAVIGVLAWRSRRSERKSLTVWTIVLAGLVLAVGIYDVFDVSSSEVASVGFGLWLTVAGGVAAIVGSVMRRRELRR